MEIEVVTTKRRLTQSLVNQMPRATFNAMIHGSVVGWVKLTKDALFIVEYHGEYYTEPFHWKKGGAECEIYRRIGRGTRTVTFTTGKRRDEWLKAYTACEAKAEHIYL